ncbi:cyclic amp-responsive element-binding protein 3 [Plakobranchus ocellatus]|uniref:Cyclic amp-responsive element-binding protein 3 n=1 Tax=Plakobranchus ocellatus TaxID=259542 RepID=A0AAV4DDJ5_9GAST|nr:cyclic amp-responsive element-binding protein 3 [Plakobranchus ocellatus]
MKSVATSPAMRALKFETSSTNTGSSDNNFLHINSSNSNSQHSQHHHQQQRSGHSQVHHQTPSTTVSISSSRHQPTIIVTTTTSSLAGSAQTAGGGGGYSLCGKSDSGSGGTSMLSYPTIQIKQEAGDSMDGTLEQTVNLETMIMPLTPPGSSGSDSDGSASPNRSAPNSPSSRHGNQTYGNSRHAATSSSSPGSPISGTAFAQPLFVSPISQSGVLILSEEEKRTLISEGYTIPSKLPLTKQEEKNLKKIRRKIKNKISAQESRRKKKEYLEALEKRVEAYNHENCDLKKKVESLENNNRSLLGQLQKLQSLVSKMPKANATQTGTALMVLVFCFAVFLGSLSPSNFNIGYPTKPAQLAFVQPASVGSVSGRSQNPGSNGQHHHHHHNFYSHYMDLRSRSDEIGPRMASAHDTSSPYATPNLKSRMLMSVDQDDYCDDYRPIPWQNSLQSCPTPEQQAEAQAKPLPPPGVDLKGGAEIASPMLEASQETTVVVVTPAGGAEHNGSGHTHEMTDVHVVRQELINAGRILQHNMSAEIGTV